MTTTTTRHEDRLSMGDRLHMPRSRGAVTGLLLLLLGAWGGLVPFWGPAFGYAFTPDISWHFTWGRFWLEILPAAAVFLGGLLLLLSANKISGWIGAWFAVAGGAWFVVGQEISLAWNGGLPAAGTPTATSPLGMTAQQIGFFDGLGVVALFLAATALGRMSVVGVRDVRHRRAAAAAEAAAATDGTGRAVPEQRAAPTHESAAEAEERRRIEH